MKHTLSRFASLLAASAAFALLPLAARAADGSAPAKSGDVTVTGEVLDMACYLDHGAHGAKHADCANTCISKGLPVGLKSADGTVYLLIGEHKPINEALTGSGGKTVTIKGKLVTRDGIKLIENAEVATM
ncbi:MAG TPA: hypothetical protein VG710_04875 [Opitutus sp.]|nr:hypothetical protein [Opitutus sp.]